MFEYMLRFAMGVRTTYHSREEDDVQNNSTIVAAAPHVIAREAALSSSTDDSELRILAETFGELIEGRVIDISLQELLNLIPRTRRRSDAYRALTTKLKRKGVTLNITSQKGVKS
jgi:hypothetical protein